MQEKKTNNDCRKQIRFGELLPIINAARGTKTFSGWIKEAAREKLARDKSAAQ